MLHVGFTGTQEGMTTRQKQVVGGLLRTLKPTTVHHGDCIGADADFHDLARFLVNGVVVHIHPPINKSKQANCVGDFSEPRKDYLVRNRDIVDSSSVMIGTPKGPEELRSGTWSTIRYSKRKKCKLYVVYPDGKIEEF